MIKLTTAEKKQIEKRFQTMYELLTKKVWIKGTEALDDEGEEIEPTSKWAKQFCLIGAVRHINGPTEEQIAALIAYQILIEEGTLEETLADFVEVDIPVQVLDGLDRVKAINNFFTQNNDFVENIIMEWNDADDRTHGEVRAMLKRAAKLYDKLMPLGPVIKNLVEAEKAKKRAEAAISKLKLTV